LTLASGRRRLLVSALLAGGIASWGYAQEISHPASRSDTALFFDFAQLGTQHVLNGLDHLLFLMVVLAGGWRARQLIFVLTSFTFGHAITLVAAASGWLTIEPAIIEPAIAATIVLIGLVDLQHLKHQSGREDQSGRQYQSGGEDQSGHESLGRRALMIFACALVHGLGLASVLTKGLLDPSRVWLSLLGFNLGIEMGQLLAAALAGLVIFAASRVWGPNAALWLRQGVCMTGLFGGTVWFFQRLAGDLG